MEIVDLTSEWPLPLYTTRHREKPGGSWFDEEAADNAVKFFTLLRHTKGSKWAGKPFKLERWQIEEVVRPLFGWKLADGTRLYRTLYLEIPRKNGKSTLASGLAGKLLMADREPGAEVYSAAADREQARIVFKQLADMIAKSSQLKKRAKTLRYEIRTLAGGEYKVLSSDVSTKWGFNVHGLVFDELHAQDDRELWDALTTATGAREQPLVVAISTAGYDKNSICWQQHEHAIHIFEEQTDDSSFLGVIYGAPENADWTEPEVWRVANPNLGVSITEKFLAGECEKAKSMPAFQNTFRRLYLNQWTSQDVRLIPMHDWDACPGEKIDEESLLGRTCFGGLDLASTTDLAAFALVFPPEHEHEPVQVLVRAFTPSDSLRERGLRDRAPYDVWHRDGLLTATPGKTIDTDYIKAAVLDAAEKFDLRDVSYDRWGAAQLVRELNDEGALMVAMGQGMASMSSPTKALVKFVIDRQLDHGGNKLLRWCADNVAAEMDAAGNIKPAKHKSSGRIDALVATIMGIDGMTRRFEKKQRSVYEEDIEVGG